MDCDPSPGPFKIYVEDPGKPAGSSGPGWASSPYDVEMFANEVDNVKADMTGMEKLYAQVHESNEHIKSAQNAAHMRQLRDEVNADLDHVVRLAKQINRKYDGLVRANAAQRRVAGGGPGSSDDNARASMISNLGLSIKQMMRRFQGLRVQMETDHRQMIESRYFAITREKATAEAIDNLIANEVPESSIHHAMQDHGRGPVLDAVAEIQERRGAMMEARRTLMALHQILLGIATPVVAASAEEGPRGIGPPSPVEPIRSSGLGPTEGPSKAGLNDYERETRKQAYIAIVVALVIIITVIVSLLNVENRLENGGSNG